MLHSQATSVPGRDVLVTATEVLLSRAAQQPLSVSAQQLLRSGGCRCFAATGSAATGAVAEAAAAAAAGARSAGLASTSGRAATTLPELLHLYKQLSKFRLSALVVSTAAAGFVAGVACPVQRHTQHSDRPAPAPVVSSKAGTCMTGALHSPAGSGEQVDWARMGWTSLGTFACAASANALNQVEPTVLIKSSSLDSGCYYGGACS